MCSPSTSGSATTAVQPREVLPKTLTPTHYDLRLTPDLDKFVSDGVVAISVRVNETTDTIVLNAADIEIHSVQVVAADAAKTKTKTKLDINVAANKDAIKYDTAVQTASIKLPIALEAGTEAKIVIAFQNIINDQMNGFYRGYYTDPDGVRKVIVSTQFEATSARLALPCWDEPALKATFDVTLVVPAHLTALSNMHSISEKILENSETKEVKFATTPVMSTYLLAFAVGELEYIEAVADAGYGQNIVHRVYTTKGLKEQGRFALEVSVKALAFFARCFGFDMAKIMSKMDHVALPEFEMGAMENWGLITYRSVRLLVDPKSSGTRSKMLVAEVVCHELAHQWFGNLTSPDWWMYLWLNEGFATWAASLAVDHVFPEWKIWDQFVTDDLGRALQLDSLRSSHPIQVDVVRAADISQIFDAISYAKGCAVIRMLVAHLTLDKFLDGLKT
ncbi:peptidase M1, membrane alanine aminopeptidase, partial [Ramicandelaber brevisporus]